jgi:hypothetical protein
VTLRDAVGRCVGEQLDIDGGRVELAEKHFDAE